MEKAKSLAEKVSEGEKLLINYYQADMDFNRPEQKACVDKLLIMFPKDKRVKMMAAEYSGAIGDNKSSIYYAKQVTEIDSEYAPVYNFLGYAYFGEENFEAAEKDFKKYIQLVPNMPNPYDSYAELLLKMGRYDESIVQYQKAYDTDNQFIGSLVGIGNNYVFKGDFTKAREYYRLYYDNAMRVTEKLGALYWDALSFLYENKLDEAISKFAECQSLAQKENQPLYFIYSDFWQ